MTHIARRTRRWFRRFRHSSRWFALQLAAVVAVAAVAFALLVLALTQSR